MEYTLEELFPILKWLTEKYTSKESTSVTYEKTEALMEAIQYCICHGSGQAEIFSGERPDARRVYDLGYQNIIAKTFQAKKLYDLLMENFCSFGVTNYSDTVVKGIPQFFLYYDARFAPQNHLLTLDYSPVKSLEHLCGIDRIYEYLECILREQVFLAGFEEGYVRRVLEEYTKDYQEMMENVFEIFLISEKNADL